MALQVWLPLNGTLENNGCKNITVTNSGATINSNGKIGNCYSFGTSTSYLSIPKEAMTNFTTEASVCFWLKILSWNTSWETYFQAGTSSYAWVDYIFGFLRNSNNSNCVFVLGNGSNTTTTYYTTPTLELNTWYHISLIYKTGYCAIYINGNLHQEYSPTIVPTFAEITHITIGMANNRLNYQTNCLLNDFRIYDHCLSAAEVKEISKGLALHYKLDHIYNNNLIPFDLDSSNYTITDYQNRTQGTINNGIYHVDGYQFDTSIDTSFSIRSKSFITLNSDTDYYLSFYCKTDNSATTLYFGTSGQAYTGLIDSSNGYFRPSSYFTLGDKYDDYVVLKIHTGSDTQYKINLGFDGPNLYGVGSYMEFSKIMLTEVEPDLKSTYINNIIYDTSGYNYNGTIIGNLELSNDSTRYNYSTTFNGTSYIQITSPSSEIKTISLWVNWNSIPSGQSVVFVDYKSKIGFGLMSTGILCSSNGVNSKVFSKANIIANTWYHFVIVNSGTSASDATRDLYINGVKQTALSSTSYWTYDLDYLQLGKRGTTSDGFSGKISDFRMYSTSLSDEDILKLYNIGCKIDNKGNVYGFEFEEKSKNLFTLDNINPYRNLYYNAVSYNIRNGELAVALPANVFYNDGYLTILKDKFETNTQYKFDLWIDYDDLVYNGENRPGGLIIRYTDGTSDTTSLVDTGNKSNPIGYKHKLLISDPSKSIKGFDVYYWTSTPAYYRWDSIIEKISTTDINKSGIISTGQFRENNNMIKLYKGDHVDTNQLIEI